jgi:hypothetical protein
MAFATHNCVGDKLKIVLGEVLSVEGGTISPAALHAYMHARHLARMQCNCKASSRSRRRGLVSEANYRIKSFDAVFSPPNLLSVP